MEQTVPVVSVDKSAVSKLKRKRKRSPQLFKMASYRILRKATNNKGSMKRTTAFIVNDMVNAVFQRLVKEAIQEVEHTEKKTIGERDVMTAVARIFPKSMLSSCQNQIMKALTGKVTQDVVAVPTTA